MDYVAQGSCLKKGVQINLEKSNLIIDALISYDLNGPYKGKSAELIEIINHSDKPILSLDIPSGINASTGETPGV